MKKIKCTEFEKLINNQSRVVILFSTDWSGSSIIVKGALHELEKELECNICFFEIDKENCTKICERYGIKNVPTILFFKDGQIVDQLNGVPSKNTIHKILKKIK